MQMTPIIVVQSYRRWLGASDAGRSATEKSVTGRTL
jgi:hypothetical protein